MAALVGAVGRAGVAIRGTTNETSMIPNMLLAYREEHDERWARLMREEFGRRRWILSWQRREGADGWIARLSCPRLAETIEREGNSRCHAIGRANRALVAAIKEAEHDRCRGVGAALDRDDAHP